MRLSDGYKNVIPSLLIFVFYVLSFGIFPFVLQHLDLSVSYAIWSALGTALTAIVGFLYFGDKMSNLKIAAIVGVIVSVMVLNYAEGIEQAQARQTKPPLKQPLPDIKTVDSPLFHDALQPGIHSYQSIP
mmetsp:Transcript_11699/g.14192  ORF Transcript_11699/g.14192 Transcript_11699/m.14192 type:complete len:130 (-) Transcript_11699:1403-1792(-)